MVKSGDTMHLKMKILVTSLLIATISISISFADTGRYSNESMASGGGARALAMGKAYSALANDAWSLFWNPSGLIDVELLEAGLMHSERFDGVVDYDAAVFAIPGQDGSVLTAGMLRLGVNGIPFTKLEDQSQPHSVNNRVEVDHYVNEGRYTFFVGKAGQYRNWRWGIAPKLLFHHLGSDYRAYGLGIDVGAGGEPFPAFPLKVGLAVRDLLGTVLAWEQTGRKEVIPPTLRCGVASVIHIPKLEATVSPAVDLSYRFEVLGGSDAAALHLGMEYMVKDMVALRIGSDEGTLTFGGGMKLKPVSIDYAFSGHDHLGDTHRISITTRWGVKKAG